MKPSICTSIQVCDEYAQDAKTAGKGARRGEREKGKMFQNLPVGEARRTRRNTQAQGPPSKVPAGFGRFSPVIKRRTILCGKQEDLDTGIYPRAKHETQAQAEECHMISRGVCQGKGPSTKEQTASHKIWPQPWRCAEKFNDEYTGRKMAGNPIFHTPAHYLRGRYRRG